MTSGPTDRPNTQKPGKPPFVQSPPEIALEFNPGDIVGGAYEIIKLLGQGGMGNIYLARHNIMLEEYAIKTLRAENLTDVSWKRFQKEAQAIGRMNHHNIIAIYNFGLHDRTVPYYVMAQLRGKTLHDIVQESGPLSVADTLPIFVEVCNGMGYAHKKGVIHRDLKPPNIVVLDKEQTGSRVKIVDFGIVKLSDEAGNSQQLTNIGEVCGSPYYMSPEQCEAGTVDARSDIYSLGCTIYEVLTGAPPFRGRNVVDTMLKHQSATPATLQAATNGKPFPPLLEQVVARMLAKSPAHRYQTMEELGAELQGIIDGREARPLAVSTPARTIAPPTVAPQNQLPPLDQLPPPDQVRRTQPPGSDMRRATSQQELTARAPRYAPANEDHEEEPEYQSNLPPHFLKLMVSAFVVLTMVLSAMGYWWVQQKPPASTQSHSSEAEAMPMPGSATGAPKAAD